MLFKKENQISVDSGCMASSVLKGYDQSQKLKVQKLLEIVKPYDVFGISNSERLKECQQGIKALFGFFNIEPMQIKSDAEANAIAMELVNLNLKTLEKPITVSQELEDIEISRNIQIRYFKDPRGYKKYKRKENIHFACISHIMKLINERECFEDRLYDKKSCEIESLEKLLCPNCFKRLVYQNDDVTAIDLCSECEEKVAKHMVEYNRKPFCAICLGNRIIQTYDALCYYLHILDLNNLDEDTQNTIDCKRFFELYLSVLIYELELRKQGSDYFE